MHQSPFDIYIVYQVISIYNYCYENFKTAAYIEQQQQSNPCITTQRNTTQHTNIIQRNARQRHATQRNSTQHNATHYKNQHTFDRNIIVMDDTNDQYVLKPHPHDILTLENGEKVQANHKGNVYFLKLLVSDYNDKFKESDSTTTSSSATESAKRVIKKIESQNPPGRFLKEAHDRKEEEEKPWASSQRATTQKPKTRWEIMSPEQSIRTSLIYFEKVKDELERHMQKEDNRKRQTNDREQQNEGQANSGKNKKAKTSPQTDVGNPYERKPAPLQGNRQNCFVIEIDSDESRTISNDSFSPQSPVVRPYVSFEKIFLP